MTGCCWAQTFAYSQQLWVWECHGQIVPRTWRSTPSSSSYVLPIPSSAVFPEPPRGMLQMSHSGLNIQQPLILHIWTNYESLKLPLPTAKSNSSVQTWQEHQSLGVNSIIYTAIWWVYHICMHAHTERDRYREEERQRETERDSCDNTKTSLPSVR